MSDRLRLVLFDVDGTLVDSQASILTAMGDAFAALTLPAPPRDAVLGIVGLSLDEGIARLAPEAAQATRDRLVAAYKEAFHANRLMMGAGSAPFYPGARAALDALAQVPEILLGVATGKSRRGLDALIEAHGLQGCFVTCQVADHHPSKPHPSMVLTALAETGVAAADAVLIGDTSFDMDMAAAAGVGGIGVSWGYHPVSALGAARRVIDSFDDLHPALEQIWDDKT
ncbi:HAD-IA family hydrolase [Seohaeicola saemankumensis]|nr:HAD-IA family hydrolase [Seohaeicola saemankumensis]MCA0873839.1 HAD-IA family hydrolase [Seohaeicola saemankumensis]